MSRRDRCDGPTELRIEQFERRLTDRLAVLTDDVNELKRGLARIDRRVRNLENQSVLRNTRLDSLDADMRQRLRVLTTDLARSKIGRRPDP